MQVGPVTGRKLRGVGERENKLDGDSAQVVTRACS